MQSQHLLTPSGNLDTDRAMEKSVSFDIPFSPMSSDKGLFCTFSAPPNCLHCFRTCELLAKPFTIRFEEQQAHLRYTVDQIFFRSSLSVLRYTQAGVDHIKTSVYALWTCVHSRLCIYTRENYAECERGVESHLGVVTRLCIREIWH